jgi:ankyrin repeat protein
LQKVRVAISHFSDAGTTAANPACQTADWSVHKLRLDDSKTDGEVNAGEVNVHQGEARDGNGMTELMSKAEDGDWRAVKKLLAAGTDPNLSDDQGFTVLDHASAVFHGHLEVVSTLLADIESRSQRESLLSGGSCLCLHLASHNGHLEVVKMLVEAGGEALLKVTV